MHKVDLGRKIPTLQLKPPLLSKYWRQGRLQAVMKSNLKCSKPWIEKFFGWPMCQVTWCSGRAPDDGKVGWSSPYAKRETWKNALTTVAYLLSPWNSTCQVPSKRCCEIIEPKLDDTQRGFCSNHSMTDYTHFVNLKIIWLGSSWNASGSVVVVQCWQLPVIGLQICFRVSGIKSQPFTTWVLDPTRVCAVTTPLHSLYEFDWES